MTDRVAATGHPIEAWVIGIQGRGKRPLDTQVGDVFRSDLEIGAVCHWAALANPPFTLEIL
ncbi:MAG: hypothetical protein PVH17_07075 [Anaerolineae bacterium]|jgi:hypothetical protein